MILPILISVSVTPGPYFFWAKAVKLVAANKAAAAKPIATNWDWRLSMRLFSPILVRLSPPLSLVDDHTGEDVGLQHNQKTNEAGEHDRVPEDEAQDRAFMSEPVGRGRGDDDRLRVDHLAHDPAGGIGRTHQD